MILVPVAIGIAMLAVDARAEPVARARSEEHGRPEVVLDRLDLSRAPSAVPEEDYLRKALEKEARRADWGAGRTHRIEYRFRVDELTVVEERGVVRVSCTASGWLPKSRHATSRLSFGGAPEDRAKLVHHVLDLVASGVVTRLADMERKRRGAR